MRSIQRFKAVFRSSQLPLDAFWSGISRDLPCWRIVSSGVHDVPETAKSTRAVTALLESCDIPVERYCEGSPVNVDAHYVEAEFLGGGFFGVTGAYFGSQRGAWIYGARAALFVALTFGLKLPPDFEATRSIRSASLDQLGQEIANAIGAMPAGKNHAVKPYHRMPDLAGMLEEASRRRMIYKSADEGGSALNI